MVKHWGARIRHRITVLADIPGFVALIFPGFYQKYIANSKRIP